MASDPTFRSYKPAQAQQYAAGRPAYPPVLYQHIYAEHAASGGGFGIVVDVGCGPGIATRDLALTFEHAVGIDPGEEMIKTARERGGETKKGEKIRYEVCEAERIASAPGMPLGEVDLIAVATAVGLAFLIVNLNLYRCVEWECDLGEMWMRYLISVKNALHIHGMLTPF
jgi:SAM-dependent methyltransferase